MPAEDFARNAGEWIGVELRRVALRIHEVISRVERFGCRATESFESLHIRIRSKFCQNSGKNLKFFRNSENVRTSQHFLERSAKFREKSVKICAKFEEKSRKIDTNQDFCRKSSKITKKRLTIFCEYFEFGAVRRCANLVDLAKC